MTTAVALRADHTNEATATASRAEVLARYRRLREISTQHHARVMHQFLSRESVFQHARRLGLMVGRTLVVDSSDVMALPFDLAVHTAPADRSRAIDRYARAARLVPGSDEALVLEAMRRARFSIFRIVRRHQPAGVILEDMFRGGELWLVDEGLESSVPDGSVMATRLFRPESFSMTVGLGVPIDRELIEDALAEMPLLFRKRPEEVPDDRRFAEAIYRVAIADGIMEQVVYREPEREAG